jgi:hypothetical protein
MDVLVSMSYLIATAIDIAIPWWVVEVGAFVLLALLAVAVVTIVRRR